MAKKKQIQDIRLADFPEEEGEQNGMNVRIYGETSYENQMAVLSHYLHNGGIEGNDIEAREQREEVVAAILEFLERKKSQQPNLDFEPTEELAWMAAENPAEYNLFADFFQVPFPDPEQPRFTFIDLFAGMGGFREGLTRAGNFVCMGHCEIRRAQLPARHPHPAPQYVGRSQPGAGGFLRHRHDGG